MERRAGAMEAWLEEPQLLSPDRDAEYHRELIIDLDQITEPLLCCPNDPDNVKPLSEVAGTAIDEVFIGSCMTNIGHFRAAARLLDKVQGNLATRMWVVPPTRMDQHQLTQEGYYGVFGRVGARTEVPGCSLCMGNQARVRDNATVVSTSTRNFPNRMGKDADVFLASSELAAISAIEGRLPTVTEYLQAMQDIDAMGAEIYRYLNFNEIASFQAASERAKLLPTLEIQEDHAA